MWLSRPGHGVLPGTRALDRCDEPLRLWLARASEARLSLHADGPRALRRVSGPVLDRLDLQIEVPALTSQELLAAALGEASDVVRARVLAARARQRERGVLNAMLSNTERP